MFRNLLLLSCLFAVFVGQTEANKQAAHHSPQAKPEEGEFLLGERFYSVDNTANRNRAQAQTFCKSKGGELAKLTGKPLYNIIQASVTTSGGYWIDGIDKKTEERWTGTNDCTDTKLDFTGIPLDHLDFKQFACLTFFKGQNVTGSKIEAISCSATVKGVICSMPLNGCEEGQSTTSSHDHDDHHSTTAAPSVTTVVTP